MRKFLLGVLIVGFVVVLAVLLFGFLNHYVPLADSLSHFRFHFGILISVFLVLFLFLRAWRWAALSVAALVLAIIGIYPAWPAFQGPAVAARYVKLIQFNTLFNNPKPDTSAQWLLDQSPDIVTLQEVSTNNLKIYDALSLSLPSHVYCKFAGVGGVAVLSKFPKLSEGCVESSGLVWMQVSIDGNPVTLASLHLHWPYPFRQWRQLEKLDAQFSTMPQPIILAGDFNAAAWSEAVSKVSTATSAHVVPGLRLSLRMSFAGLGPFPMLPIDQILLPEGSSAKSIYLGPPIGSDHLPVVAQIGMSN